MDEKTTDAGPGRIVIDLFTTLDGVAQAPGAPDEDTSDGFRFGGWQAGYPSPSMGEQVRQGMETLDALLLGRRTYDIFASYWPHHTEGPDGDIGRLFDRVPKYVASRHPNLTLDWQGSARVGDDLASDIDALRARHREVHVIGSIDFAHTLISEGLFDELKLWVYPILLGRGKKVFVDDVTPSVLRLLAPPETDEAGVMLLRYAPTGRTPDTGSFG